MPKLQDLAKFAENGIEKIGKNLDEQFDPGVIVKKLSTEIISGVNEFANDKLKAAEEKINGYIQHVAEAEKKIEENVTSVKDKVEKAVSKTDEVYHAAKMQLEERAKQLRVSLQEKKEQVAAEIESKIKTSAERMENAVGNRMAVIIQKEKTIEETVKLARSFVDDGKAALEQAGTVVSTAKKEIAEELKKQKDELISIITKHIVENAGRLLWKWLSNKVKRTNK